MSQIWNQIRRLKAQVPDCLVLFRYGDFYELFDEDAEVAAPILDIVLTSRDMGQGRRAKMAGIPYHALNSYLPKLLEAGHRVAVVEQTGRTPGSCRQASWPRNDGEARPESGPRGIIEREVIRVVSAGTVVEPGLLDERHNNYLAAIVVDRDGKAGALAYADVSTGEFAACQVSGTQAATSLAQELERLRPAEVPPPPGRRPSAVRRAAGHPRRDSLDLPGRLALRAGYGDRSPPAALRRRLPGRLRPSGPPARGPGGRRDRPVPPGDPPLRRGPACGPASLLDVGLHGARLGHAPEPRADSDRPRRERSRLSALGPRPDRDADGRPNAPALDRRAAGRARAAAGAPEDGRRPRRRSRASGEGRLGPSRHRRSRAAREPSRPASRRAARPARAPRLPGRRCRLAKPRHRRLGGADAAREARPLRGGRRPDRAEHRRAARGARRGRDQARDSRPS